VRATALVLACAVGVALARPSSVTAQFADPCELTCIGTLGATGFVAATGASIAVGRITGGMSTVNQGLFVWGTSFAVFTGGGMALSGNGARQERAVYAAGIGTLTGALMGLTIEAIRTDGDEPRVLAGTLVGAMVGALAGGVYGALSYTGDTRESVPLMSISVPF